jgi:hypothetical protein
MGIFKRLLGPSSLECPEAPIVRRQMVLPIFNGGVGLISLEVIAPTIYMGNWASNPYYGFHVFVGFLPIFVEGDRCE